LIAFYHNHRRYRAGKRADKTPMEILTGKKQKKEWIEGMLHIHPKVVDTFFEYSTAKAHRYISPLSLSQSRLTGP
jgi:hypothetical protein